MCGIIGYVGARPLVPILLEGLKRLEYRGYDSAGVAVVDGQGLQVCRASGKLANLERALALTPMEGTYGLGHTRWATHGVPNERNAHPHVDCRRHVALVHNGIIENYEPLKKRLQAAGHVFASDTDTEVVAHLIESYLNGNLATAVRQATAELEGAFALAVVCPHDPERIVVARQGAPVVIGLGQQEYFVSSDVIPILPYTRSVLFLNDGEMAVLDRSGVGVFAPDGQPRSFVPEQVAWNAVLAEKGGFRHFMQKEIYEQPRTLRETLQDRVARDELRTRLPELAPLAERLAEVNRVHLVACGTSWHAALVGKTMIETLARLPVEVDYASEYRYRDPLVDARTLSVLISQSGETADTLAAGREARMRQALALAVTNVPGSTLTRECDATLPTRAGPEIGVAATKTFSTQLIVLYLLAVYLAEQRSTLPDCERQRRLEELFRLPHQAQRALESAEEIEELASRLVEARDALFLGRGIHVPVAFEGALKLKEISYIHAEGCPAGEMKHGPNALIDSHLPVIFLAGYEPGQPASEMRYRKTLSNMEEVRARDGILVGVLNQGDTNGRQLCDYALEIPPVSDLLLPLIEIIPLQLLAYHIAVLRGCDVDQPRNLAKSVTVE